MKEAMNPNLLVTIVYLAVLSIITGILILVWYCTYWKVEETERDKKTAKIFLVVVLIMIAVFAIIGPYVFMKS